MAGRGRPKKNEEDKQTYQLLVGFTEKERKELELSANNHGYWSMSAFIRYLVSESAKDGEVDGTT